MAAKKRGMLMLVIRCNFDDFPVAIGDAAKEEFAQLQRIRTEAGLHRAAMRHIRRIVDGGGWPVSDVTGFVKVALCEWTTPRNCRELDCLPRPSKAVLRARGKRVV